MKTVLKRKQNQENSLWLEVMEHIEEYVSREELEALVKDTKSEIEKVIAGKKVAYAWSGGKDSIVLSKICEELGVNASVFAHTELEYPAFMEWCNEHMPKGCTPINTAQDLLWLAENPEMLFPKDSKTDYRWMQAVQQQAIKMYFRHNKLDMILVGHRKADGNYIGTNNISRNGAGVVRYSPLAEWPHEALLAYIHYNNLDMPPIYGWKDGYLLGTHPWADRLHTGSVMQGFAEVYEIDPSIVESAAEVLPEARQFLEGVAK